MNINKELRKEILFTIITAVGIALILYVSLLFLPLKEPQKVSDLNQQELSFAKEKCSNLCMVYKTDLNYQNSPCLSDVYTFNAYNYACDVVNSPRNSIDDLNSSQCQSVLNKTKAHFIEVDNDCKFVQAK